jgi:predicted nuclease of predicted toxin-antitoxin system
VTFLVDENLPRSLAPELRRAGFAAEDVRDRGLGGRDDAEVLAYAISYRRIVMTSDLGLADLRRLSRGTGAGVVLVRFPRVMPTARLNAAVVAAVWDLRPETFVGSIVVIAPRGVRVRRAR